MRQDLDIAHMPLEQCHKRTFQAVSAGSPPCHELRSSVTAQGTPEPPVSWWPGHAQPH